MILSNHIYGTLKLLVYCPGPTQIFGWPIQLLNSPPIIQSQQTCFLHCFNARGIKTGLVEVVMYQSIVTKPLTHELIGL
jgi:hypothetical protein